MIPWISRTYTYYARGQCPDRTEDNYTVAPATFNEQYTPIVFMLAIPVVIVVAYSVYAYMVGQRGLKGGLHFSLPARRQSFRFRKDFFVGNCLFWIAIVVLAYFIMGSSACIDRTGMLLLGTVIVGRSVYHLILFLTYAPGPQRRVFKWIYLTWWVIFPN